MSLARLKASFLLPLLALIASAAGAQSHTIRYCLPQDGQIRASHGALIQKNLIGAFQAALNSEDDSLAIQLDVEGSIGAFANVGIIGSRELKLTRVADGYELSFLDKGGFSFGVEAIEKLEVAIPIGGEVSFVLHFDRLEDIGRAIQCTALAVVGAPALVAEKLRLDELIRSGLMSIDSLETTTRRWNHFRQKLHRGVVHLRAKLVQAPPRVARSAIARRCDAGPGQSGPLVVPPDPEDRGPRPSPSSPMAATTSSTGSTTSSTVSWPDWTSSCARSKPTTWNSRANTASSTSLASRSSR